MLLGVSLESKGCRLYDPTIKNVLISRDVIFAEKEHLNLDGKST